MNEAALTYVKALVHPQVDDVARAVLTAIAHSIPEGETTTPLISMAALARLAHVDRRTVWTWLPVLVEIGEVRVVDGGQGRRARYTMAHVAGADPITAVPLPLVGAAPRRPPARSDPISGTLDLFDLPLERGTPEEVVNIAITRITRITSWPTRAITRITSWAVSTITRITRITSSPTIARSESEELVIRTCDPAPFVRSDGEELVIRTCDPCDPAFDVRTTTTTTRTTTAREASTAAGPLLEPSSPRTAPIDWYHDRYHAWCGRVCMPKPQHAEFIRRLGRRPGETDAALDARAFACYAAELATIPDDHSITETDFAFWRPRFARMLAAAAPRAPTLGVQGATDDVWTRVLQRIETKVNRRAFYEWFRGSAFVSADGDVILVAVETDKGDWIRRNYAAVLDESIAEVQPGARVEFVVDSQRRNYG